MMKCLLFLVLWIPNLAFAGQVKIDPMYEINAFIPNAYIPFRVISGNNQTVKLIKAEFAGPYKSCGIVIDKFRANVFLVQCTQVTSNIKMVLTLMDGEQPVIAEYGPFKISMPFNGVVVAPPTSGDTPPDPELLQGRQLHSAFCLNCHQPAPVKKDRTLAQIRNAITGQPQMNGSNVGAGKSGVDLRSMTDDEIRKIVKYLGTL